MQKPILHELFIMEIQDLYDAEQQLVEALPMMAEAAESKELKAGFEKHLTQTEEHLARLEKIAEQLEFEISGESCDGMSGLISEGEKIIEEELSPVLKDLALIGAAQRVEHYEIAGYGTALAMAKQMGHDEASQILEKTLDEESQTDELLTTTAEKIYAEIA